MSSTLLTQYKTKFSKALDFIIEDLRLSEDEVQELLTWMTRTTRNRIFRPAAYSEVSQPKEVDTNNFEAVFIPDLDELNTKTSSKDKKNEIIKPSNVSNKPRVSQGAKAGATVKSKASTIAGKTAGRTVATGSTKSPVPKLGRIDTKPTAEKTKTTNKSEKIPAKATPTAATTKTNTLKQVPNRPSIKPVQTATKPSKPKN